jgi:predicted component of type VI protein secretion system
MFCGECGRAVLVDELVGAGSVGESSAVGTPDWYTRFAPASNLPEGPVQLRCPQCDAVVDDADVFCGECGFVLKASVPGPRDTVVVEPVDAVGAQDSVDSVPDESSWPFRAPSAAEVPPEPEPEPGPEPEPVSEPAAVPEPVTEPESEPQPRKDPNMETENQQDAPAAPAAARARTIPDPFPWGADIDDDAEDIEATRIVSAAGGDRFVLQFSTGESVTVSGAGLIGRNPAAQPGEYVDQLVSIFDVGKSVSKTHLEFGQEGGRFWVSDRYSTNGSVVRQPEAEARRCEPGRRYFVVRGTRIDVGEQFFVVS